MREIKTYYSFGGVQHTEAQTEESFANGEFNDLCM